MQVGMNNSQSFGALIKPKAKDMDNFINFISNGDKDMLTKSAKELIRFEHDAKAFKNIDIEYHKSLPVLNDKGLNEYSDVVVIRNKNNNRIMERVYNDADYVKKEKDDFLNKKELKVFNDYKFLPENLRLALAKAPFFNNIAKILK